MLSISLAGAGYKDTAKLELFEYSPPTTRSSSAKKDNSGNRISVHGLDSFKSEYRDILESLLCAWNDATLLCNPEDRSFLYCMLPVTYDKNESDKNESDKNESDKER